jgi:hypothetical protein
VAIFLKDPMAIIDFAVDWSANIAADRMITASVWQVLPGGSGAVVVEAAISEPQRSIATLSGGQSGQVYHVTNRVTFSDGRNDERTLVLRVEDQ